MFFLLGKFEHFRVRSGGKVPKEWRWLTRNDCRVQICLFCSEFWRIRLKCIVFKDSLGVACEKKEPTNICWFLKSNRCDRIRTLTFEHFYAFLFSLARLARLPIWLFQSLNCNDFTNSGDEKETDSSASTLFNLFHHLLFWISHDILDRNLLPRN